MDQSGVVETLFICRWVPCPASWHDCHFARHELPSDKPCLFRESTWVRSGTIWHENAKMQYILCKFKGWLTYPRDICNASKKASSLSGDLRLFLGAGRSMCSRSRQGQVVGTSLAHGSLMTRSSLACYVCNRKASCALLCWKTRGACFSVLIPLKHSYHCNTGVASAVTQCSVLWSWVPLSQSFAGICAMSRLQVRLDIMIEVHARILLPTQLHNAILLMNTWKRRACYLM